MEFSDAIKHLRSYGRAHWRRLGFASQADDALDLSAVIDDIASGRARPTRRDAFAAGYLYGLEKERDQTANEIAAENDAVDAAMAQTAKQQG